MPRTNEFGQLVLRGGGGSLSYSIPVVQFPTRHMQVNFLQIRPNRRTPSVIRNLLGALLDTMRVENVEQITFGASAESGPLNKMYARIAQETPASRFLTLLKESVGVTLSDARSYVITKKDIETMRDRLSRKGGLRDTHA